MSQPEGHYQFFIQATVIIRHAQSIINSAPNIDRSSIEQCLAQLEAVRIALHSLEDGFTTSDEQQELIGITTHFIIQLEALYEDPTETTSIPLPTQHTGQRGRPAYILDLELALHLHDLGNTWQDIATAIGCTRQTIYNHLNEAGLSSSRKEFTQISDEELDTLILNISQEHPFSGSTIMKGHLEAQSIHVSLKRVKQSLKRVNPEAVLLR